MSFEIINPTCLRQVKKTGTFGVATVDLIDNQNHYGADSDFWGIWYDQAWEVLGTYGSKVSDGVMVEYGGKLYFGLGRLVADGVPVEHTQEINSYDLNTQTFASEPDAIKKKDASYCEHGGYLYIYGGNDETPAATNTLHAYQLTTGNLTSLNNGPHSVLNHSATIYDDEMYIFGGDLNGYIYKYNIANSSSSVAVGNWSTVDLLTPAPIPLYFQTATLIGDKIYFHGGYAYGPFHDPDAYLSGRLLVYDIPTDTWTEKASGPKLFEHNSMTVDGNLIVTGKINVGGTYDINGVWHYDTTKDIWTKLLSGGESQSFNAAYTQVGNKLYMWGGRNNNSDTDIVTNRDNRLVSFDVHKFALAIKRAIV